MQILVACEESQRVCYEFRKRGHKAFSCDIQGCSGDFPEWHIMADVLTVLGGDCVFQTQDKKTHEIAGNWDMIIAFPPCTNLAVSGARWFPEKQRDFRQQKSVVFFMQCALAPANKIAVENPVGIMSTIYKKPSQIIHPYQFGEPYRKTTCLWLKGLPSLVPTCVVKPDLKTYTNKNGKQLTFDALGWKVKDPKERSKTFKGIAKAMAEQWG